MDLSLLILKINVINFCAFLEEWSFYNRWALSSVCIIAEYIISTKFTCYFKKEPNPVTSAN